jgi:hypothetical protein
LVIPLVASFHPAAPVMAGCGLSGPAATVIAEPGGTRSPWLAASVGEQHGDEHVGQPALLRAGTGAGEPLVVDVLPEGGDLAVAGPLAPDWSLNAVGT